MRVGRGWRVTQDRRRPAARLVRPTAWSLWAVPRPFLAFVLTVDAAAVAVVAVTATLVPVGGSDLSRFGLLTVGSILHLEVTRGVERLRELHAEGRVFTNLKSVWTLAGLLVLPPPLVAGLIAVTYVHMWFRLGHQIVPHRWVWSACNVTLASAAGGAILVAAHPQAYPGPPHGPAGLAVVVAVTATRWAVNRTLTSVAIMLMRPGRTTARQAFEPGRHDLIECGALAMGVLAATLLEDPAFLLVFAVVVVVVHRGLMAPQFESSSNRDPATGLHNARFWHELAGKALERAEDQGGRAGLLLIHVDRFAAITAEQGPAAGDRVLRAVAATVRAGVRRNDLLGRLPGEDLAVVLPDIGADDLAGLAERIRGAIRGLSVDVAGPAGAGTVSGLTASIGGAIFPDHAEDLDGLMLTADSNVIAAQTRLGDQVRLPRPPGIPVTRRPGR